VYPLPDTRHAQLLEQSLIIISLFI